MSWFSIGAVTWYLLFYILSIIILLLQGEAILFSTPPSRGDNIVFTSSFKGRQYCFHLLLQGETILFSPPPSRGDNTIFTSSFKGRQYCFHLLLQGETILFSPPSRGDYNVFILIIHHEKFHTKLLHVISANHQ